MGKGQGTRHDLMLWGGLSPPVLWLCPAPWSTPLMPQAEKRGVGFVACDFLVVAGEPHALCSLCTRRACSTPVVVSPPSPHYTSFLRSVLAEHPCRHRVQHPFMLRMRKHTLDINLMT